MFGFVNSNKKAPQLGGEIFQQTRMRRRIVAGVVGFILFVLFNLVLYFLTQI